MSSATTTPDSTHLYAQWLQGILESPWSTDLAQTLSSMSNFRDLRCPTTSLHLKYARSWCQLADFLWTNREKQLHSKVDMTWDIEEVGQRTDVYWFEVAQACARLTEAALIDLVQDLQLKEVKDFASAARHLDSNVCARSMILIKRVLGVCCYVLQTATKRCIYLESSLPKTMAILRKQYHSLRVLGCFLYARKFLSEPRVQDEYTEALNYFHTASELAKLQESVGALTSVIESLPLLTKYCEAKLATLSSNWPVAQAHVRILRGLVSERKIGQILVDELDADTRRTAAVAIISDPTMLVTPMTYHATALKMGISPLDEEQQFTNPFLHVASGH